jgi:hypothetical protein
VSQRLPNAITGMHMHMISRHCRFSTADITQRSLGVNHSAVEIEVGEDDRQKVRTKQIPQHIFSCRLSDVIY